MNELYRECEAALGHHNVAAFLAVIRFAEHGKDWIDDPRVYRREYGGNVLPEEVLAGDKPRTIIAAGGIRSSAKGAYQFLNKTWDECKAALELPDFSPKYQDVAAVYLIRRRKALQNVLDGRLDLAVARCADEWASFPGSSHGQPMRALTALRKVFSQYGGLETQAPAPVEDRSVAPFIAAAIPALLNAAPELIKIFGNKDTPVAERNQAAAIQVVEMAKQVTGSITAEEAVGKIEADPNMAKEFREEVHQSLDQLLGMVSRLSELDESSRDKARGFAQAYDAHPVLWRFTFIQILSLVFVGIGAAGAALVLWPGSEFSNDIKAAVITLIVVGGFTGVKEFWFGSSNGSRVKDLREAEASVRIP